jgi:hypothetical protein
MSSELWDRTDDNLDKIIKYCTPLLKRDEVKYDRERVKGIKYSIMIATCVLSLRKYKHKENYNNE